ncbi:MAG: hypothetical protein CM15mP77_0170 [Synechococcus sp.]|nr:MAG: hypothetical protein CM15mP77_0170 [Synechococcus sp.]
MAHYVLPVPVSSSVPCLAAPFGDALPGEGERWSLLLQRPAAAQQPTSRRAMCLYPVNGRCPGILGTSWQSFPDAQAQASMDHNVPCIRPAPFATAIEQLADQLVRR